MTTAAEPGAPRIVVVGLGPGGPSTSPPQTLHADRPHRRTASCAPRAIRAPTSCATPTTFDDVYEARRHVRRRLRRDRRPARRRRRRPRRDPLRRARLAARARTHGAAAHAPTTRIELVVLPAMSFLDVAWARLGIDPVEAGVALVDGHEFATRRGRRTRVRCSSPTPTPTGCFATSSSPSKAPTGDEPVAILQRLGTPDELIVHTTWAELDRTVEADHLTCVYIPHLADAGRRRARPLPPAGPHAARAVPVGQRADPPTARALPAGGDLRGGRRARGLDPDDPATDDALDRGARRPALPDRVPRHHRRAGRPVHDGRRRARACTTSSSAGIRTCSATSMADMTPTTVLRQLGRHQARREAAHVGVRRRPTSHAVAAVRRRRCSARPRRSASTGPTSTGALPKIAEEAAELASAADRGDDDAGPRGARRPAVRRRQRGPPPGVEPEAALRAATAQVPHPVRAAWRRSPPSGGIDLHAADLATLDALWDEVKRAS